MLPPRPRLTLNENRFLMRDLGVVLWISNQHSPLADFEYRYKNIYLVTIFEIGERRVLIADPRNLFQPSGVSFSGNIPTGTPYGETRRMP
jgi:hypothetical protein